MTNSEENFIWQDVAQLLSSTNQQIKTTLLVLFGFPLLWGIGVGIAVFFDIYFMDSVTATLPSFAIIAAIIIILVVELSGHYLIIKYGFRHKWAKISYALTNKRALVFSKGKITEQSSLANCSVSTCDVRNRINSQIGNVIFIENGVVAVNFIAVLDPYSVSNIASNLISALQPKTPPATNYKTVQMESETIVSEGHYCTNCGKPIKDDSTKFCGSCGKKIN
jgi:hypothetical protein